MDADQGESIHFWQTPPLAGVELLSARYIEHRFAPHVHDGYVIGMIMAGAQRYRYRGAEHLAGSGTLVLINPDELHTCLLYTSPSPRDGLLSRMPSSA